MARKCGRYDVVQWVAETFDARAYDSSARQNALLRSTYCGAMRSA